MHPDKTKIVYCMDGRRKGKYLHTSFDFLGYTFRPRGVKTDKCQRLLVGFNPAVSQAALKQMRKRIKALKLRRSTQTELATIAALLNPMLRGWMQYYGRYRPTELNPLYHYVNLTLVKWARRKYKRLRGSQTRAAAFIASMHGRMPRLFAHWHLTTYGARV
jgi:RNA-directed DNA polymerase